MSVPSADFKPFLRTSLLALASSLALQQAVT